LTSAVLTPPIAEPVVTLQPSRSLLELVIFYGTFGLLLFGPLAFGSTEPWSIFVLQAGSACLFLLWVIRQVKSSELAVVSSPLFVPMFLFIAIVGVQVFSGYTGYRYQTIRTTLLYFPYGALAFLVVQSLRRTSQLKSLTIGFSVYGFALALFGLVQSMSSTGKLYWIRTPRNGGWIYGPYVNHNHYAGLMEMLVPIPLVFALSRYAHGPRRTMAAVAAAVMASTIFLSGSRGGMVAFCIQMAVLAGILLRQRKSKRLAVVLGAFLAISAGLLAWLGGGELTKRMASIRTETRAELSGGTRLDITRDGLKMFIRKPVLGWGLGVFPDVYPQFRSFYSDLFVNAAHDDYLQLLVETGALGFVAMLWFVVAVYRRAAKKVGKWTHDVNGAVALAAMLGVTGILVHSFFDFNLQVPANAALFYVLCAVAAMEPRFGLTHRRHSQKSDQLRSASTFVPISQTS
jgi:O-antigen ligase